MDDVIGKCFRLGCRNGREINDLKAEVERLTAQLAEARQAERAAVVAWLREQVTCGCGRDDCIADKYPLGYAKQIEAGEHLQKEGVLPDE